MRSGLGTDAHDAVAATSLHPFPQIADVIRRTLHRERADRGGPTENTCWQTGNAMFSALLADRVTDILTHQKR